MAYYSLPIMVELDSDHADRVMREIAEVMYAAIEAYVDTPEFEKDVRKIDLSFSIYVKPDQKTFGQKV